jgi:transposase-like protein
LIKKTGLPFFHDLLPTRSKWAGRLFLLKLKRLGKSPSKIMTDGLKSYVSAIAKVFPKAKHLLCLFHHQHNVTRCVKEHFPEGEQEAAAEAKKRMNAVLQSHDTRTVTRRLDALEQPAHQNGWKITNWLTHTRSILAKLLPAVRSNRSPTTTNDIERFFREFHRFYKTRCGFHSVKSAKREIIFFLVMYLFTIQPESGTAPIEKIIPEANTMPLYRLLNYPFADEMPSRLPPHVKLEEDMATESAEEVVSLP